MAASQEARAGAAAAFILIATGLALGVLHAVSDAGNKHSFVDLQPDGGGLGPDALCLFVSAKSSPQALSLFGLDDSDGDGGKVPYAYVRVRVCANPGDGGLGPDLPAGMEPVEADEGEEFPYDGGHAVEAWLVGSDSAPFECACSAGSDCAVVLPDGGGSLAAPLGVTLQEGEWSGAGCVPKPCVEFAGSPGWPAECPSATPAEATFRIYIDGGTGP